MRRLKSGIKLPGFKTAFSWGELGGAETVQRATAVGRPVVLLHCQRDGGSCILMMFKLLLKSLFMRGKTRSSESGLTA